MTRKRKTITLDGILPDLRADDAGWGPEPLFNTQPNDDAERKLALTRALGWYSANFGRKTAKDCLLHYAAERGVAAPELKVLRATHERHYDLQLGWVARLAGRGLQLTEQELARVGDHLKVVLSIKRADDTVTADAEPAKAARPNIQETMIAKARECAGDLEGLFDEFLLNGNPDAASLNVVGLLTERNILPQHVSFMLSAWTARRSEYESVLNKDDDQLVEGYSQYGRVAMKSLVKWCDAVIAGLQSYATVKKVSRAPRKRKPVPVERVVAKVKYLKTFTDAALKIDLTSVSPVKLVGATECFLYDASKRRLTYYVADSHAGTLSVKGTTLLGFDAVKSQTKTLRKPGITLPALMKAGKPAARKVFAELTTVGTQPNGRTNENTVILRVA